MITGTALPSHYVAAHVLHRRRVALAMNWTMVIVAVLGMLLAATVSKRWGALLFFGAVGGLIGEAIQARLYLPRKARQLYSQYKGIDSPITYRWDSEKLFVRSQRGEGERKWEDFHKVKENDELFLLYTTDALFEVVPKEWFGSAAQIDEFRGHLRGDSRSRPI